MPTVNIKPLSVNKIFQGRRFISPEYKAWSKLAMLLIPKVKVPEGNLHLILEFGFSNAASDLDNPQKPFIDLLQKRLLFNDKRIYKITAEKKIVKKGAEYIKFSILSLDS
jgi:Holliday junction resolvase RusA-like endonuclease